MYESALLLDAQPTNQETESQHGSYSEPESANQVSAAQSNRKYGHRHESHVSGHYGDKSSELKHAHKQQENEFKMVEILSDPIGPDTTTTSTTTTVTTQRPTTTTTTTTGKYGLDWAGVRHPNLFLAFVGSFVWVGTTMDLVVVLRTACVSVSSSFWKEQSHTTVCWRSWRRPPESKRNTTLCFRVFRFRFSAAPVPAQTFIVNGRAVQCKTYVESSDATSFTCRNVM